jgi:hypothetical protein
VSSDHAQPWVLRRSAAVSVVEPGTVSWQTPTHPRPHRYAPPPRAYDTALHELTHHAGLAA